MSVAEQIPVNAYTANGATTIFNFSFKALLAGNVVVTVNGVAVSNYTVSGLGTNAGAVTFSVAPLNNDLIVIRRMSKLARQNDYQVNGDLLSESFNYDYDQIWHALQEANYNLSLAPKLKAGSALAGLLEIPNPVAGQYLRWNPAGNGFDSAQILDSTGNVSLQSALADSANDANGDALVFSKVPTGVGRSLHSKLNEFVTVKDFGAVGDGVTDDRTAIQNAIDWCSSNRVRLRITSGNYRCNGGLVTKSNLHLESDNNAWLIPYNWSITGSFITNLWAADSPIYAGAIQENVTLINLHLDGSHLPYDLVSNDNAIGFARGMSKLRIHGGYIKGFANSWSGNGAGGKGVDLEQGVYGAIVTDLFIKDCGQGIFVQGMDGVFASGASKATTNILINNIALENCGCAIAVLGVNTAQLPDGDPNDQLVLISNVTFKNCGHYPDRPMTSAFQKSGIIVLGEAQNTHIRNVRGNNDASYTAVWPAGGTNVAGAGLSGPIGAIVWGHGRNITIRDVEYYGDCDQLVFIGRARAIGDDSGPTGIPSNVFRFDCSGIKHYGACENIISCQTGMVSADVNGTSVEVYSDIINGGFVNISMWTFNQVHLHIRDNQLIGKQVIGSCNNIYLYGNVFGLYPARINYPSQSLMFDGFMQKSYLGNLNNTAVSFTPQAIAGILCLTSDATLMRCLISYRATPSSPQCHKLTSIVGDLIDVTTGVLTGITGTPGRLTVSCHTDGKVYIENRIGAVIDFKLSILG